MTRPPSRKLLPLALACADFLLAGCFLCSSEAPVADEITVENLASSDSDATGGTLPGVAATTLSVLHSHRSANHDVRRLPVSLIVLHYTAAPLRESLNALCCSSGSNRVSAHYVVDEDGTIYQLVDESQRAWHAGVSRWKGITDVNSASIGIEIVNLGHDAQGRPRPYAARQIESVIRLCLDIQSRYAIRDVIGHSDVAPRRKIDPGELFPWYMLKARGVRTIDRWGAVSR